MNVYLSEAQLADISRRRHEQTLIGKAIVDKNFRFIDPNAQLCAYLGITKAELIGKKFTDITPEPLKTIDAENATLMIEGKLEWYRLPKFYEMPPHMTRTYVVIDVLPILSDTKEFLYFQVEIVEITKDEFQRKIKETLRNHLSVLRSKTSYREAALLLLKTCSLKDLGGLTVKIMFICFVVYHGAGLINDKAVDLVRQLLR